LRGEAVHRSRSSGKKRAAERQSLALDAAWWEANAPGPGDGAVELWEKQGL
jgi:hypothetical protein